MTKQFHAGDSTWVPTRHGAMTFASASDAMHYAQEHHLDDVSILVWAGEPGRDVLVRPDAPPPRPQSASDSQ